MNPKTIPIPTRTLVGLKDAYQYWRDHPHGPGSTPRDRLESWIEGVLEDYDNEVKNEGSS